MTDATPCDDGDSTDTSGQPCNSLPFAELGGIVRPGATESESGTAGTRTQNQRIMSQRESDVFPGKIAVSAPSAGHCAASRFRSLVEGDPRLIRLLDAWPMLSENTRDAIARLAADDPDDADDLDDDSAAELAGKVVAS